MLLKAEQVKWKTEHLKKIKMRRYIAKIKLDKDIKFLPTGQLGEKIFELWFNANYQDEQLFKQAIDRDYQKIDFADEKGFTYQVKTTRAKTYTFNCDLDNLKEHLRAEIYVFIQIDGDYAYIEPMYEKDYIFTNIKKSFKEDNQCFIYSIDLQQQKLF
jgi:hypothetical protein